VLDFSLVGPAEIFYLRELGAFLNVQGTDINTFLGDLKYSQ